MAVDSDGEGTVEGHHNALLTDSREFDGGARREGGDLQACMCPAVNGDGGIGRAERNVPDAVGGGTQGVNPIGHGRGVLLS